MEPFKMFASKIVIHFDPIFVTIDETNVQIN